MSYHLTKITKGVLGELSKIQEELDEVKDAEHQNCKIMVGIELSDLYGSIEAYAKTIGLTMEDLKIMSNATKRAFQSGHRVSPNITESNDKKLFKLSTLNIEDYDTFYYLDHIKPTNSNEDDIKKLSVIVTDPKRVNEFVSHKVISIQNLSKHSMSLIARSECGIISCVLLLSGEYYQVPNGTFTVIIPPTNNNINEIFALYQEGRFGRAERYDVLDSGIYYQIKHLFEEEVKIGNE